MRDLLKKVGKRTSREKRRHGRSKGRRLKIIEAALKCFNELGFNATTMEQICRVSRASIGSIYHHFKGKEELAVAVYLEGLRGFQAGMVRELKQHPGAKEGMAAMIRYNLECFEKHPDWARYLLHMRDTGPIASANEEIAAQNRLFVHEISSWLAMNIEAGALRQMPVDLFLSLTLGPCSEFGRRWLAGNTAIDLDTAARDLAESVWRSVSSGLGTYFGSEIPAKSLLDPVSRPILFWTGPPGVDLLEI